MFLLCDAVIKAKHEHLHMPHKALIQLARSQPINHLDCTYQPVRLYQHIWLPIKSHTTIRGIGSGVSNCATIKAKISSFHLETSLTLQQQLI